jgi:hypothetical protein
MAEIKVKIPKELEPEVDRIEREIEELVSSEQKSKLIAEFVDDVMKGASQLGEKELVELGRGMKRGRAEELRRLGLM